MMNLRKIIDELNTWPLMLIFVVSLGYFVDLFDLFLFTAFKNSILKDIGVTDGLDSIYINVLNCQLGSSVLGAFVWGFVGDKIGRKTALLWSIIIYSVATIFTPLFATDVFSLTVLRIATGFGLGGELGAGIALISESMPQNRRSLGAMVVGLVGMLGVVSANLLAKSGLDWKYAFYIGGVISFVFFILRLKNFDESKVFQKHNKEYDFLSATKHLFTKEQFTKYLACIFVGAPTFFVAITIVKESKNFGQEFGMLTNPDANISQIYIYLAIALGDILCGLLSQHKKSRRFALFIFHLITWGGIIFLVTNRPDTALKFYLHLALIGLGVGYWTNMVLNASEQFSTNVRAMVTITVPNIVRALLIFITPFYDFTKSSFGLLNSVMIVGSVCSALAVFSLFFLKDGFKADLDY